MKWHNLKIMRCPNDGTQLVERYKNSYFCKACRFGVSKEKFDLLVQKLHQIKGRANEEEFGNLAGLNNL